MDTLIAMINDLMWGAVLIYLLIGVGLFFTFRLGFIQVRHFGHMFSVLRNSRKSDSAGISSFQALCTSLAARVGTGNLAGVAVAIYLGGPGAIFWMWLIAFIGMATAFVESTLAQLYKVKDEDGNYRGGPAYYMERGLGMRWMGVVFSLCLLLAFGLVFNAVQANSISLAMNVAFGIPDWVSGLAGTGGAVRSHHLRWHPRYRPLRRTGGAFHGAGLHPDGTVRGGHEHQRAARGLCPDHQVCLRHRAGGFRGHGLRHLPGDDQRYQAWSLLQRSRYGLCAQCRRDRDALSAAPGVPGLCADAGGLPRHHRHLYLYCRHHLDVRPV